MYIIQVIANLDLYLTDPESNKELVPLIIVKHLNNFIDSQNSIEFWDNDFQRDCGLSVKRSVEKNVRINILKLYKVSERGKC